MAPQVEERAWTRGQREGLVERRFGLWSVSVLQLMWLVSTTSTWCAGSVALVCDILP